MAAGMSDLEQDARLNRRLIHNHPGRRFLANDDARWGELILPAPDETAAKTDQGLRIMMIASMGVGLRAFRTAVAYERRFPERINLVGLATDDAANDDARISLKKRLWHFLNDEQRLQVETHTVETALAFGIPVYTGEVKVDWFRNRLAQWRPDVIMVCGFGQILDESIMQMPPNGIYNFHPSDLVDHRGAGVSPFGDLAALGAKTTSWTVHRITKDIDAGPIVGQSPPINIRSEAGEIPDRTNLIVSKMLDPLSYMVHILIGTLVQRSEAGQSGPLERLDFAERFPAAVKADLMSPIVEHDAISAIVGPGPAIADLD